MSKPSSRTIPIWEKPIAKSTHLFEIVMAHDVAGEEPACAGRLEEVLAKIGIHVEIAIGLAAGELDFERSLRGIIARLNDR